MNKLLKTFIRNFSFRSIAKYCERFKISNGIKILILSIAVFGIGFLASPVLAQNNGLVVEYWTETKWEQWLPAGDGSFPIFGETNFAPGDSVTRRVKVTNNSGETQRIATEAINYPGFPNSGDVPTDDLSQALLIIIREKAGSDLYGGSVGEKTLFNFYEDGETYLSDISAGQFKEYEFEISFPAEKENEWQGATTTFDILIGFQGVTIPSPPTPPDQPAPPGGAGGFLPPGLTILHETYQNVKENRVTITWLTSYKATSQVIYAKEGEKRTLDLTDNQGTPPKYGYAHTTLKHNTDPKVTGHSVTITGLTSGTTYYYRAVSHASAPTISRERSFTTLGVAPVEEEVPIPADPVDPADPDRPITPTPVDPEVPVDPADPYIPAVDPAEPVVPVDPADPYAPVVDPADPADDIARTPIMELGLMAAIGRIFGEITRSTLFIIIVSLCLMVLIVIGMKKWKSFQKKR